MHHAHSDYHTLLSWIYIFKTRVCVKTTVKYWAYPEVPHLNKKKEGQISVSETFSNLPPPTPPNKNHSDKYAKVLQLILSRAFKLSAAGYVMYVTSVLAYAVQSIESMVVNDISAQKSTKNLLNSPDSHPAEATASEASQQLTARTDRPT